MTAGTLPAHDAAAEPRSIDLRECGHIVRRRWVLVLAATLIGAIAAAGYAVVTAHKYAATSEVIVLGLTQGPGSPNTTSPTAPQVNMSTEQTIAASPPVIAQAAKIIGVQPAALQAAAAKGLTVTVPASTLTTSNLLQITWTARSPRAAQAGANAFAAAYLAYRHRELAGQIASLRAALERQLNAIRTQVARLTGQMAGTRPGTPAHARLGVQFNQLSHQSTTISNGLASMSNYSDNGGSLIGAARPTKSSGLGHKVIVVIGALLGLFIGLALAFVRDAFDDRVREPAQLERSLGAPILAVLPRAESLAGGGRDGTQGGQAAAIAIAVSPESRTAEAVRALRVTLVGVAERRKLRTVLLAAADSNVSSSRMVAELGVALAESGRRVLLVAADMRGSMLPHIFDVPNDIGLSDLLVYGGDPEVLIRQPEQASGVTLLGDVAKRLGVLPNGAQIPSALSMLDSSAMVRLLQDQREAYDFVVLDCPPATEAADVFAIAGQVDGVAVMASPPRIRARAIEELRRRLDQVGAVVVGGIFIDTGTAGQHPRQPTPPPPASRPSAARQQRRAAVPTAPPPHQATEPMPVTPEDPESSTAGGPAQRL
jgi:Mrp family chromosome partitioning ATPase/capsular polysaccharide biosynthesis protein